MQLSDIYKKKLKTLEFIRKLFTSYFGPAFCIITFLRLFQRKQSETAFLSFNLLLQEQFLSRLNQFQHNPIAYGNLTVRSLLDLREHCLSEFDFHDPYMRQKQWENEQAMALLPGKKKKKTSPILVKKIK